MNLGDKNTQRLIILRFLQQLSSAPDLLTANILSTIYQNPFSEYPPKLCINNYLKIDFSNVLVITIMGHGLKSDVDLLSKIRSERKLIRLLDEPEHVDNELVYEASKVFRIGIENIQILEYSW